MFSASCVSHLIVRSAATLASDRCRVDSNPGINAPRDNLSRTAEPRPACRRPIPLALALRAPQVAPTAMRDRRESCGRWSRRGRRCRSGGPAAKRMWHRPNSTAVHRHRGCAMPATVLGRAAAMNRRWWRRPTSHPRRITSSRRSPQRLRHEAECGRNVLLPGSLVRGKPRSNSAIMLRNTSTVPPYVAAPCA